MGNQKHANHILVCEYCQIKSSRYVTGKISGKSLCASCYKYEYRYGYLVPLNERRHIVKHKNYVLVCEFCQRECKRYTAGKVCGKSLCYSCYAYESRYGYLLP